MSVRAARGRTAHRTGRVADGRELPLIAIESPLACGLEMARRIFDAPIDLLGLWPGVERVTAAGDSGFCVVQRLELPFWGDLRQEFRARMRDRPRDRRQRYAIWQTDGWFFDRAVLWKLHAGKEGLMIDFCSQHAVSESRLEQAVNAYRSRTVWPMRHDADAILQRLVISFVHDRLVELDRAYVNRIRDWLNA